MTLSELDKRVSVLEKQVASLLVDKDGTGQPKDWRSTLGMFTGDEVMKAITEAGRKIREAERREARRRPGRKRKQGKR